MSDLIRKDTILGNQKVIVGNINLDLVLETLGTLYIKQQNTFIDLLLYIQDQLGSELNLTSLVSIITDISLEVPSQYKEGAFIFSQNNNKLYFKFNDKFNLLTDFVQSADNISYVRTDGTTEMTGPLTIKTDQAPLKVISKLLVKNLNANYLEGISADNFAQKTKNEVITGEWEFTKNIKAKANIRLSGDFITDGSIGSPVFTSGMTGTGWRLDANTNTLTIDNLVVRGILSVFELVVNKITATNGSLWVTDAFKVGTAYKIQELNLEDENEDLSQLLEIIDLKIGNYIIIYYNTFNNSIIQNKPAYLTDGSLKEDIPYTVYNKVYRLVKELPNNTTLEQAITNGYFSEEELYGTETIYNESGNTTAPLFNRFDSAIFDFIIPNKVDDFKFDLEDIRRVYLYYHYFGNNSIYFLEPEDYGDYPNLKSGDILLCQKFDGVEVKKYNSVVLSSNQYGVIIQIAENPLDNYTAITYNDQGDPTEFVNERLSDNDKLGVSKPNKGDNIVKIGNIFNPNRRGSLYLTSSEQDAPRVDVLDNVFRPDYSVLYYTPKYKRFKSGAYEYYVLSSGSIPEYNGNKDWATNDTGEIGCRYITGNEVILSEGTKYLAEITNNTKVRLGNLNNIYNLILGNKQPYGYGLYGENVFLTGDFYLNNGKSVMSVADDVSTISGGNIEETAKAIESAKIFKETTDALTQLLADINKNTGVTQNMIKNTATFNQSLSGGWNLFLKFTDTTSDILSNPLILHCNPINLNTIYSGDASENGYFVAKRKFTEGTIFITTPYTFTSNTQFIFSFFAGPREAHTVPLDIQCGVTNYNSSNNMLTITKTPELFNETTLIIERSGRYKIAFNPTTDITTSLIIIVDSGQNDLDIWGTLLEIVPEGIIAPSPYVVSDGSAFAQTKISAQTAVEATINNMQSTINARLQDNTAALNYLYSTSQADELGRANVAVNALMSGMAGITLTGVSYEKSNTYTLEELSDTDKYTKIGDYYYKNEDIINNIPIPTAERIIVGKSKGDGYTTVAKDSSISLVADLTKISSYIKKEINGGTYTKVLYTTAPPLTWGVQNGNLTFDYNEGWISEWANRTYNGGKELILKIGEETYNWQYYFIGNVYPESEGSIALTPILNTYFIIARETSALFENGKIKGSLIDADTISVKDIMATVDYNIGTETIWVDSRGNKFDPEKNNSDVWNDNTTVSYIYNNKLHYISSSNEELVYTRDNGTEYTTVLKVDGELTGDEEDDDNVVVDVLRSPLRLIILLVPKYEGIPFTKIDGITGELTSNNFNIKIEKLEVNGISTLHSLHNQYLNVETERSNNISYIEKGDVVITQDVCLYIPTTWTENFTVNLPNNVKVGTRVSIIDKRVPYSPLSGYYDSSIGLFTDTTDYLWEGGNHITAVMLLTDTFIRGLLGKYNNGATITFTSEFNAIELLGGKLDLVFTGNYWLVDTVAGTVQTRYTDKTFIFSNKEQISVITTQ